MSDKDQLLEVVRRLPANASLADIRTELEIFMRLREAETASTAGRTHPQDRVREMVRQWTTR